MKQVFRWYRPNPDDFDDKAHRAADLLSETAAIESRQSAWHQLNLWNATLYTNRELIGFRWGEVEAEREMWPTNLRTENLVERVGEAMLSKAASSPLKPTPLAHGNSHKIDRDVRLLDRFLFGVWRQTKAESACVEMFRDAFMSGLGCVRGAYDADKKTLHVESVFFDNIIIDNRECANRAMPRTYRIRQVMPRADVEARYGVELDDKAPRYAVDRQVGDGWVVVVEAWRLPDAKGKDGYHMVAAGNQILSEEEWTHSWVPLTFFHWQDRTSGFFCKGGVEQVVPYQVRQNELNDAIEASQDIACRARMKIHANSMIDLSQWDNEAGRFLMWSGSEPQPMLWPTNLQELYQERVRNSAECFNHMGLSEMYAQADLPQGVRLDSSAGVREFRNLEDSRHLRMWSSFEESRLNVARMLLNILGTNKGAKAFTTVYHPGGARARSQSIPYDAVRHLTEDEFSWTLEAVPLSSMSPAARRELVRDFTSRGLLKAGSPEARRLEGNINLELTEDLEMAAIDEIKYRILDLLENGDYEAPDETTDCVNGVAIVTANMKRLRNFEDVDPNGPMIQNHLKWIVAAAAIQTAITNPPQPIPFAPTQGVPGTSAAKAPMMMPGQMMMPQ